MYMHIYLENQESFTRLITTANYTQYRNFDLFFFFIKHDRKIPKKKSAYKFEEILDNRENKLS